MNKLIIITGQPASGKTTLGKMISSEFNYVFLDKDILFDDFSNFITSEKTKPHDKDSKFFKENIRPLEYSSLHKVIMSQVELNNNIVSVAPYGKEIMKNNTYFKDLKECLVNKNYELIIIYLVADEEDIKNRMLHRKAPADYFKLNDWAHYIDSRNIKIENLNPLINEIIENKKTLQTFNLLKKYF